MTTRPVTGTLLAVLARPWPCSRSSPLPASAHITVNPDQAAAGGYAMITLRVPHGATARPTPAD